jgi:hypothetical protein
MEAKADVEQELGEMRGENDKLQEVLKEMNEQKSGSDQKQEETAAEKLALKNDLNEAGEGKADVEQTLE